MLSFAPLKYRADDSARCIGLISTTFATSPSATEQIRREFCLEDRFTILLAAGGIGFGPKLEALAELLGSSGIDAQVIISTGSNSKMGARLLAKVSPMSAVLARPTLFREALRVADLVVGKAGWLTLSEAMIARKPTIIVDQIPGQEEQNADVAVAHRSAKKMGVQEALLAIRRYSAEPQLLHHEFAFPRASGPHAGAAIIDTMLRQFAAEHVIVA